MENFAPPVTPPAYWPIKTLKSRISETLERFFGCRHENPAFPIAGIQECPDCGAWRDYIFSPAWKYEYDNLLLDHTEGYITADQFAAAFHKRLICAGATFIGEWRRGGRQ